MAVSFSFSLVQFDFKTMLRHFFFFFLHTLNTVASLELRNVFQHTTREVSTYLHQSFIKELWVSLLFTESEKICQFCLRKLRRTSLSYSFVSVFALIQRSFKVIYIFLLGGDFLFLFSFFSCRCLKIGSSDTKL